MDQEVSYGCFEDEIQNGIGSKTPMVASSYVVQPFRCQNTRVEICMAN